MRERGEFSAIVFWYSLFFNSSLIFSSSPFKEEREERERKERGEGEEREEREEREEEWQALQFLKRGKRKEKREEMEEEKREEKGTLSVERGERVTLFCRHNLTRIWFDFEDSSSLSLSLLSSIKKEKKEHKKKKRKLSLKVIDFLRIIELEEK